MSDDNTKLKLVGISAVIAVIILIFVFIPNLTKFIITYPVFIVSILILLLMVIAAKKKEDGRYIKLGLIIAISGILLDVYLPPYSTCALAPTGTERLAIQQAGIGDWAIDTLACKMFIETLGNFDLFKADLGGNILIIILPLIIIIDAVLVLLAWKIKENFWASAIQAIILTIVIVLLGSGHNQTGQVALTGATVFTYVIFPLILFATWSWLFNSGDKD